MAAVYLKGGEAETQAVPHSCEEKTGQERRAAESEDLARPCRVHLLRRRYGKLWSTRCRSAVGPPTIIFEKKFPKKILSATRFPLGPKGQPFPEHEVEESQPSKNYAALIAIFFLSLVPFHANLIGVCLWKGKKTRGQKC